MSSVSPDDDASLIALVRRSALLPDATLRRHWERVIPHLPTSERYALAAALLKVEQACQS